MEQSIKIGKIGNSDIARGFTLVELLLVLFLVVMLTSIVTPIIFNSIHRARESTLKEDLHVIRKAIDDFYADTGKYPESLETLVDKRYIRMIPVDPMTDRSDSWVIEYSSEGKGIKNIHSNSEVESLEGSRYRDW